ncbi:MAG TPA: urate hydroxylase PuuD [Phenylobacterium sp.]|nr:urate hydroxylase PuuD [Phenylobacterium sp.]
MQGLLSNFRNTMILSGLLALVMIAGYLGHHGSADVIFVQAALRWVHVVAGILWIGLLYYFNFVQIRKMPDIPPEMRPAISKHIAPEALFWFRWAAVVTLLSGLLLAWSRGYLLPALTLGASEGFVSAQHTSTGGGRGLATIMFLNVWLFIWPNQKIALGIVEADDAAKAKAGRTAMLFSRTNTLLSLPMLVTMAMNQTVFG